MDRYRIIDQKTYYRRGVLRHFAEDARCSMSMTVKMDVTELAAFSRRRETHFSLNFLYLWEQNELVCWDRIHPTQYVYFEESETCTPVYTTYLPEYKAFYQQAEADLVAAKKNPGYHLDMAAHPNWFDASYLPWVSYDAFDIELPDGHLFFNPIVNWGRWRQEGGRLMMPVSVRLNHAAADGYHLALVFRLLEEEMEKFAGPERKE